MRSIVVLIAGAGILGLFIWRSVLIYHNGLDLINFGYTVLTIMALASLGCIVGTLLFRRRIKAILAGMLAFAVLLIAVEGVLCYGVKVMQVDSERNGNGNYSSMYRWKHAYPEPDQQGLEWVRKLHVNYPNSEKKAGKADYSYIHRYNSMGLRNEEVFESKDSNEQRFIILGDSFTEGFGAPEDSTWVSQLETILQSKYPAFKINCINAGSAGSDPVYEYALLEPLAGLNPDVVIMSLNISDIGEVAVRGGLERYIDTNPVLPYGPWWEPVYATSFTIRHIMRGVFGYDQYLFSKKEQSAKFDSAYESILKVLAKCRQLAEEKQFSFILIVHPTLAELEAGKSELQPFAEFVSSTFDFPVVAISPCFQQRIGAEEKEPNEYFWPADKHMNSEGYGIFAQCVAEYLTYTGD